KRYRTKASLKLDINGRAYNANAVDYSFDGIGAVVENSQHITKGALVNVHMDNPDLDAKGEVAWIQKTPQGLTVGIKRDDASRRGNLEDYSLSDVLIGLQRSHKTGVLKVENDTIIKKVYIKDGDMIFSSSNQDNDRLGEILLKAGKINLEQYNKSVELLKETGKKQGAILVRLGYLKPQELVWVVRRQVENIILSLFSLEGSSFEFKFKEGPLPSDEVITLKLSAANLIYRGIKRIANPQKIFNLLCVPMDAVLCFSSNPLNLFQDIELNEKDKRILSFVDGRAAIKDIVSLSQSDVPETLKVICALLSIRLIEVKGEDVVIEAGFSAADIMEEREIKIDEEFMSRVEKIYSGHEAMGYYGILEVKQWASVDDIKRAYYKAAKEFHPDRHFYINSPAVKWKLNAIFSYIAAAYTTLSSSQKRKDYDNRLTHKTTAVPDKEESARSMFAEGKAEFRKENYSEAFQLFGQAVYLDNAVAEYHYYYGLTLIRLKRFKEAGRALERAVELAPSNPAYLTDAGHIYVQLGFRQRARSSFEKAIKIDPSNNRAVEGLRNIPE
ncbi:MAG: DnaJ domain-containing protein, partial [Nitrospirae bacterium]|nr:DnaJ domain-containing protein [Nitrospirota bacterium]